MSQTGIVLAGGLGTRLRPVTNIYNKHLALVYSKPMIYYPIQTLKDMGCTDLIIISGGENIGGLAEMLKDGSDFGLEFTYRVQLNPGGIAEALHCAKGMVNGLFPVILGDNYFSDPIKMPSNPTIYTKDVSDPQRFGVYQDQEIIEKPTNPTSNKAVVGLYVYDESVFDFIQTITPSARGELEITSVNNWYLSKGAEVVDYLGYWHDMGLFDSLLEVANKVKKIESKI